MLPRSALQLPSNFNRKKTFTVRSCFSVSGFLRLFSFAYVSDKIEKKKNRKNKKNKMNSKIVLLSLEIFFSNIIKETTSEDTHTHAQTSEIIES